MREQLYDTSAVSSQHVVSCAADVLSGRETLWRVIRGREAILELRPLLSELAAFTGQEHDADDLEYFLSAPKALKKMPYLLLSRAGAGEPSVQGYCSAVLVSEYYNPRVGTRVFATSDLTGRRNLFAPVQARAILAARAARLMVERGAQIVHIAYAADGPNDAGTAGLSIATALAGPRSDKEAQPSERGIRARQWTLLEQSVPLYLPIEASFDKTLERLGKGTRTNLRYYRRRAEQDLGCTFVPEVRIGLAEFLAFNAQCTFAVPAAVATWRHRALSLIERPVLCGTRDLDGRWLTLLGGRRNGREIEIDWQMNRDDLPKYSLSIVARSLLIDEEVRRGSTRLYFEGGTKHVMAQSFVQGRVVELTVKRDSLYTRLLTQYGRKVFPKDNYVGQILTDDSYCWRPW